MITPGRLWYLLRKNSREGWSTPFFRERIRPRIVDTPPVTTAATGPAEVHVLTSQGDWINLLWSLKSFYHFAERDYPLVIHADGTCDAATCATLAQHFPTARIIGKSEADAALAQPLAGYPLCARYRGFHALARKAFDTGYYLQAPRMLLLDSDLVFFAPPRELIARTEDPEYTRSTFNADVAPGLNISPDEARRRFGIEVVERINSGLALVQREVLNLDWMEEFLACQSLWDGHPWRIEQTLLALGASRHGVELLPDSYRVSLRPGLAGCVVKHYVGAVRHLMYREGMAHLWRGGFLERPRARASVRALAHEPVLGGGRGS